MSSLVFSGKLHSPKELPHSLNYSVDSSYILLHYFKLIFITVASIWGNYTPKLTLLHEVGLPM